MSGFVLLADDQREEVQVMNAGYKQPDKGSQLLHFCIYLNKLLGLIMREQEAVLTDRGTAVKIIDMNGED